MRKENEVYRKSYENIGNLLKESEEGRRQYEEQKRIDALKWEEKELERVRKFELELEREREREREEEELEKEREIADRKERFEEMEKKEAIIREKMIQEIKQKWRREGDVAIAFDRKHRKQRKMIRKAGFCDFVIKKSNLFQ